MIGKTLSHYRVVEKVGVGLIDYVYRAWDEYRGRDVAIEALGQPGKFVRIRAAELRPLTALIHPNIAEFLSLEKLDDSFCLIYEFVPGETLAQRLAAGSLSIEETINISLQVAQAHEAAHEKNIFHGWLSASKVKLTPDVRVKVFHFGLAKAIELEPEFGAELLVENLHEFEGTEYKAPELIRGNSADARSDIWSIGVLLYEMTTGDRPFKAQSFIRDEFLNVRPAELSECVPARLRSVIQCCLANKPGQRYHRVSELRVALEEIQPDI